MLNKNHKKIKTKFKKIIIVVGLITALCGLSSGNRALAGGWPTFDAGGNLLGQGFKFGMETVRTMIQSMLLSQMQKQAVKQIRNAMHQAFSGGGEEGGSMAITDYQKFIFGSAGKVGQERIENIFQSLMSSASPEEQGILENIQKQIQNEIFPPMPSMNFNKIANGEGLFSGETMDFFEEYNFGGNHPYDIYLNTKERVLSEMKQKEESQKAKAIANQGINSKNGVPGAITAQVMAKAESASIDMITNATTMQQVVANIAVSAISSFVEQGFNQASNPTSDQARNLGQSRQGGMGGFGGMNMSGGFGMPGMGSMGTPGIPSISGGKLPGL